METRVSKKVERPALAKLMKSVSEGKVNIVLVEEADRLARNSLDLDGFLDAGDRPLKPK
jgi:DNA invertase Pin-like site-specific DNA recombinase